MKTQPLFQVKDSDRRFYEKQIAPWLPEKFYDMHTHIWLKKFKETYKLKAEKRTVSWPSAVVSESPAEDLLATYQLMFPGKSVTPLVFASLSRDHLDEANAYVAQAAQKHNLPALIFSDPAWHPDELEKRILQGNFKGIKSYLTMAPASMPAAEISIFDFFPPQQLELVDKHGWIVMLHIPRPQRLRDPLNLKQLLEIEERYPNLQLIVAHIGRAYCNEDVGDAFQVLAKTQRLTFDFSANCNSDVIQQALETVGPKRVLFGSDLPILRMRARRICENGFYINLVPKGLYPGAASDPHIREISGEAADELTFFMYEELAAFGRASLDLSLTDNDIQDVFFSNANSILAKAGYTP